MKPTRRNHINAKHKAQAANAKTKAAKRRAQPASQLRAANAKAAQAEAQVNGKQRTQAENGKNATPVPSAPVGRAVAALQRLGLTQAALDAAPKISATLRVGTGGLKQVIEAARYSEDVLVIAFLK